MPDRTLDPETVADLVDLLDEMDHWQLGAERWAQVDGLIARANAAVSSGNAAELKNAIEELEANGPTRAKDANSGSKSGQPAKGRVDRAALKESLKAPQGKKSGESGKGR